MYPMLKQRRETAKAHRNTFFDIAYLSPHPHPNTSDPSLAKPEASAHILPPRSRSNQPSNQTHDKTAGAHIVLSPASLSLSLARSAQLSPRPITSKYGRSTSSSVRTHRARPVVRHCPAAPRSPPSSGAYGRARKRGGARGHERTIRGAAKCQRGPK